MHFRTTALRKQRRFKRSPRSATPQTTALMQTTGFTHEDWTD